MKKNLYFTKDHELVRSAVRNFVKKEIEPNVDDWEEQGHAPLHELFKKMGDLGFLGIRYDAKYGGQGLDYWYELVFLEEINRISCGGIPMAISVQTNMATPALDEFGSDYIKETFLKPAINGDMVASIAVTEPGCRLRCCRTSLLCQTQRRPLYPERLQNLYYQRHPGRFSHPSGQNQR